MVDIVTVALTPVRCGGVAVLVAHGAYVDAVGRGYHHS
jgi:hypothetical protein